MSFQLHEHISFCTCGGRTTILDLRRDAYLRLPPTLEPCMAALQSGEAIAPEAIGRLVALGLGRRERFATSVAGASASAVRTTALLAPPARRVSWRLLPETWWSLQRAARRLRTRPLESVVRSARRRKALGQTGRGERSCMVALALEFHQLRSLVAIPPICLTDSLALIDMLARRRLYPELVFGVTCNPFSAHCWVQAGDVVLNDFVEEVRAYQPILVV